MFIDANRPELAEDELAQCKIIERYLPAMMTEEELTAALMEIIAQVGATSPQDHRILHEAEAGLRRKLIAFIFRFSFFLPFHSTVAPSYLRAFEDGTFLTGKCIIQE